MAKSSEWKKIHVDTFDLQLDTNNYRFPPQLKGLAQPQLLNALMNNYNVDSIAESISEKGFYQHELLVVVHEGNKHIDEFNADVCVECIKHYDSLGKNVPCVADCTAEVRSVR